jgi:hypothetical protein
MPEDTVNPETQYLVADLQELVTGKAELLLQDAAMSLNIRDFETMPRLTQNRSYQPPAAIQKLARELEVLSPGAREFAAIDLDLEFPVKDSLTDNPFNAKLKWSDGVSADFAFTGIGPILLINVNDERQTIESRRLHPNEASEYLDGMGLPFAIWGEDFAALLASLRNSRAIVVKRVSSKIIDHRTSLDVTHLATYQDDIDSTKDVVQELSLDINHHDPVTGDPTFRNTLRFARSKDESSWEYRGTYSGQLAEGQLLADPETQTDPSLVVPPSKLLDKALAYLSGLKPKQL